MPVNLEAPAPERLKPVPGVRLGTAKAGVRKANRRDVLVFSLAAGSQVAGVFTSNRFCAAPVQLCRERLAAAQGATDGIRALLINTGNANAGTGADGLARARSTCVALAGQLGVQPEQVLPFSTGVIMETLPNDRIEAGLPAALADLSESHWAEAAEAIMTTDTLPKAASVQVQIGGRTVTVTGISKGAGMIRPNMATMLGFVATDSVLAPGLLQSLVREAADQSFNRITIDGDTSTNDSFVLIATQQAGHAPITQLDHGDGAVLRDAVVAVATSLAQAIVRDGEGATKFITVQIDGGATEAECRLAAYAIAPLAAGQDGVLCQRPESRADPGSGRLRRHWRSRPDPDRPAPRRRARGSARRSPSRLPGRRRPAGDEAKRDHGAGASAPRHGQQHRVDLRLQRRVRSDQRRLPQLRSSRPAPSSRCGSPSTASVIRPSTPQALRARAAASSFTV